MKPALLLLILMVAPSTASAAVDLVQVPAICGSAADVFGALATKMPNPRQIGRGGNSRGEEVATLFTGNGYWALIAGVSADAVCVVASGSGWTASEPESAAVF